MKRLQSQKYSQVLHTTIENGQKQKETIISPCSLLGRTIADYCNDTLQVQTFQDNQLNVLERVVMGFLMGRGESGRRVGGGEGKQLSI